MSAVLPLALRQSGEYDADFEATVDADGRYAVERGGYATAGRRVGQLTPRQHRRLGRLAEAVDLEGEHPAGGAYRSRLRVGDAEVAWGGPPPTAPLAALVNALAALGGSLRGSASTPPCPRPPAWGGRSSSPSS